MKTFEVTITATLVYVIEAEDFDEALDAAKDVSGWGTKSRLEVEATELYDAADIELAKSTCDEFYPANA